MTVSLSWGAVRTRVYVVVVMLLFIAPALAYFLRGAPANLLVWGPGYENAAGTIAGNDFIAFYAAAEMVTEGAAAETYDADIHAAKVDSIIGVETVSPWGYPPSFLMLVVPLAFLPYLPAMWIWLGLFTGALVLAIHRIAPHPLAPVLALIYPGAVHSLLSGQNGSLTAALVAAGLYNLDKRPVLAGCFLGLLSYKPHLGVILPVCLLAGGHFRSFAAMAATAGTLAVLSALALGLDTWLAFVEQIPQQMSYVSEGVMNWKRMPSVYVAVTRATASATAASLAQFVVGAAAVATCGWVWWRSSDPPARAMAMTAGILLATPYLYEYDLAILAAPVAYLAWEAWRGGLTRSTALALAVLWAAPLMMLILPGLTNQQLGPLFSVIILILAVARCLISAPRNAREGGISAH